MKPFQYSRRHIGKPEFPLGSSIQRSGSQEKLIGYVQGQKASDLEERVGNSLSKSKIPFEFRVRVSALLGGITTAHANLPGETEIDFLIDNGQITPILVDGEIAHFMTPYQKIRDDEKIAAIDKFGEQMGWARSVRIPFTELRDQAAADNVIRRVANGQYIPQFAA